MKKSYIMIKSSCPLSFETIVVAILEYWRQAGPDHAMPIIILVLFLFCFESFHFRNEYGAISATQDMGDPPSGALVWCKPLAVSI
jgi:hypothetical protein